MATSYTSLEPTFTSALGTPKISFSSEVVSLASSTSFLWTLGITMCVLAAGAVFVRGGVYRIQASETGIRKSNEEFRRGSLGLLGVLGLFLLLYTLNRSMVTGDIDLSGFRAKQSEKKASPLSTGTGTTPGTQPKPAPTPAPSSDGSEEANRAFLGAAGITINKSPCVGSNTSCTNVANLPQETLDMLVSLKSTCACSLMVTGGTEPGHQTHGPGKRPVDLQITSDNDGLYSFLKKGTVISNQSPCNVKYGWGGFTFWDEMPGCSSLGGARHFHAS